MNILTAGLGNPECQYQSQQSQLITSFVIPVIRNEQCLAQQGQVTEREPDYAELAS